MSKNKGAGIIFLHNDKVLLLKSSKNIWEIPGGRKESGENFLDAARRETLEEIGSCPSFKLIGKYIYENDKNKYKIYFGVVDKKFKCKISDEHEDWGWFNLKNLPQPLHVKVVGALKMLENFLVCNNIDSI